MMYSKELLESKYMPYFEYLEEYLKCIYLGVCKHCCNLRFWIQIELIVKREIILSYAYYYPNPRISKVENKKRRFSKTDSTYRFEVVKLLTQKVGSSWKG